MSPPCGGGRFPGDGIFSAMNKCEGERLRGFGANPAICSPQNATITTSQYAVDRYIVDAGNGLYVLSLLRITADRQKNIAGVLPTGITLSSFVIYLSACGDPGLR